QYRHLLTVQQSDTSTKKWDNVGFVVAVRANAEHAGVLKEERALLRKEQFEASQVYLATVNFSLAKVGVDRCRRLQARGDVVKDIKSGLGAGIVSSINVVQRFRRDEWTNIEPATLMNAVQAAYLACFGDLKELQIQLR